MGPLADMKVIEMAGIGPGPFAAMMLADMGADVLRIERVGSGGPAGSTHDVMARSRVSAAIDLKNRDGVLAVLELCASADALIEGFRPGVMERLGLGPDACLARNPSLVYGRITGYGQSGPLAPRAGHDINYIALSGALSAIGRAGQKPTPPLNLVGDFGGGGMLLAFGLVCGVLEARRSGTGQVVDAAMLDGSAALMAMFHGLRAAGVHDGERGSNLLDSGAHFYETYETQDGKHVAVGALEPQFYAELMRTLGFDLQNLPAQLDRSTWPAMKQTLSEVFRTKTRAEWSRIFEGRDACCGPVLTAAEALEHPHVRARGTFVDVAGLAQPAPAPRFSRSQPAVPTAAARSAGDVEAALLRWGMSEARIYALRAGSALSRG